MAAGWLLVFSLTLFQSLVMNHSSEGPFPSATTEAGFTLKDDVGTLCEHEVKFWCDSCFAIRNIQLLSLLICYVALEMLFTGEPLSAREALMHGLVSKVVPEDKLEEETMKISQKICESSKSVLALGKATFYRQMTQDLDTAYKITTQVMTDNLTLRDGQEGIEAFIQKRKPVWSHSQDKKK